MIYKKRRTPAGKTRTFIFVLGGIVLVLFGIGVIPKLIERRDLLHRTEQLGSEIPVVQTVVVQPAPFVEPLTYPRNIGAMQYATIFARVDGYLKSRMVDIGDQVKEGQLLAEIDTPTIDEELAQSQADVAEARAQLVSAKANLKEAKAKDQSVEAQVKRVNADQEFAAVTANRWV